jgi:hypothetical protein
VQVAIKAKQASLVANPKAKLKDFIVQMQTPSTLEDIAAVRGPSAFVMKTGV